MRHWLAIILIVLAAIFIVQNTVRHQVHLLWATVEAATWLVLSIIFFVGVVTGVLIAPPPTPLTSRTSSRPPRCAVPTERVPQPI